MSSVTKMKSAKNGDNFKQYVYRNVSKIDKKTDFNVQSYLIKIQWIAEQSGFKEIEWLAECFFTYPNFLEKQISWPFRKKWHVFRENLF